MISERQKIHIKHQALFSLKDKSEKIKVSSAAIFVRPLRFKIYCKIMSVIILNLDEFGLIMQ